MVSLELVAFVCGVVSGCWEPKPTETKSRKAAGASRKVKAASAERSGIVPVNLGEMPTPALASVAEPQHQSGDAGLREVLGRGRVIVRLVSDAAAPATVKIRALNRDVVLAQVSVLPGSPRDIHLNPGAYELLVKLMIGNAPRYFKGGVFKVPASAARMISLTFKPGISQGSAEDHLREISSTEFDR